MISEDSRPSVPAGVRVLQEGRQVLLVHPDAPRWAVVNPTGLAVTRLCDGSRTAAEIGASLADTYGVELERARSDVHTCLASLEEAGFLDSTPPTAGSEPGDDGWRLHLYLTQRCNLRCRHCGVHNGHATSDQLSTDEIRSLIDQAVDGGAYGVAFGGGEPLLRSDCLELLTYSAGRIKTLLSTNGVLIDEAVAKQLVDLGVITQVSLDGATATSHDAVRGEGTFDHTWRAISLLQEHGAGERVAVNVTLMQPNVSEATALVDLARERGVPSVRFTPVVRMGRAQDEWKALRPSTAEYAATYRELFADDHGHGCVAVAKGLQGLELEPPEHGMWCRLGKLLVVESNGDIYPCSLLTDPQFRLGNIREMSLDDALHSSPLQQLIGQCDRRRDEIDACRACTWKSFCQAGCPGAIWHEHGTFHATDDLCDLRRELYEQIVRQRAAGSRQNQHTPTHTIGQRDADPDVAADPTTSRRVEA